MKPTIVIADDSLTIQKVIKITLAGEEYILHECTKAGELEKTIKDLSPDLVLLDFNLSENKTGYDLAREIKNISPKTKTMMLYGTFDAIEKELLDEVGVGAHIVKPFDGNKFISNCRNLLSDSKIEDEVLTEPEELEETNNWVVDQPDVHDIPAPIENEGNKNDAVSFEKNFEDWGINVPGVIGSEDTKLSSSLELPPVIKHNTELSGEEEGEEVLLPVQNDLEYPDVTSDEKIEKAKFNLDEWKVEVPVLDEEDELDKTDAELTPDIRELQERIDEDSSERDLWAVDEVTEDDLPQIKPHGIQEVKETVSELDNSPAPSDFPIDVMAGGIQKEDIDKKVEALLAPLVDKIVKERVDSIIEKAIDKVAWEVIPDLAENLIRKELKQISSSLLNSD